MTSAHSVNLLLCSLIDYHKMCTIECIYLLYTIFWGVITAALKGCSSFDIAR